MISACTKGWGEFDLVEERLPGGGFPMNLSSSKYPFSLKRKCSNNVNSIGKFTTEFLVSYTTSTKLIAL